MVDSVQRAKQALNVNTDAALARSLGVAASVVAAYNRRHSVPLEQCIKIAEQTGVSLDWLILGKEDVSPENNLPVQEQMLLAGFRALDKQTQVKAFQAILSLADGEQNTEPATKQDRQFSGDIGQYNAGDGRIDTQTFSKNK